MVDAIIQLYLDHMNLNSKKKSFDAIQMIARPLATYISKETCFL